MMRRVSNAEEQVEKGICPYADYGCIAVIRIHWTRHVLTLSMSKKMGMGKRWSTGLNQKMVCLHWNMQKKLVLAAGHTICR